MTLRRPSLADIKKSSEDRHLKLTETAMRELHDLVCENLDLYDEMEQYPDVQREVLPATRVPLGRPSPTDDPLNAVVQYARSRLISVALCPAKNRH